MAKSQAEHGEAQLAEIELLLSMFPSQDELEVEEVAYAELRAYVAGSADCPPNTRPELCIKIRTHTGVNKTLQHIGINHQRETQTQHKSCIIRLFTDAGADLLLYHCFGEKLEVGCCIGVTGGHRQC